MPNLITTTISKMKLHPQFHHLKVVSAKANSHPHHGTKASIPKRTNRKANQNNKDPPENLNLRKVRLIQHRSKAN